MKSFLKKEEEERILFAIQDAELKTSGEIRVHIAAECRGAVYEAAVKRFEALGMHRTAERNGVLIHLALKNREFAVIGDVGIHEKVNSDFWNKVRDAMADDFARGDFVKGLIDGIKTCGAELARFFPRRPSDINELPDRVSREDV